MEALKDYSNLLLLPLSLYSLQQRNYSSLTKHRLHYSLRLYMAKSQWLKGVRQKEKEEEGRRATERNKNNRKKQKPRSSGVLNDIVSR